MSNDYNTMTSSSAGTAEPFIAHALESNPASELYLDLLKKCLTRYIFDEKAYIPYVGGRDSWTGKVYQPVSWLLAKKGFLLAKKHSFDRDMRREGADWPAEAETMIGLRRLDNLQSCIVDVLQSNVPGDLIETGVWRGGACIFMRGVLKAYGDHKRLVWAADSFDGLPRPNATMYPADANDRHWTVGRLAVSLDDVKANFSRYGLLDEQVRFLKGWFKDTLSTAPFDRLSILRLDGDMYESTMDALTALYPRLSLGGYIIVDDYNDVPACKAAVHDYRNQQGIREQIVPIGTRGVYWKRETP